LSSHLNLSTGNFARTAFILLFFNIILNSEVKMSKIGLGWSAEAKWDANLATFMPILESVQNTCIATGCWDISLPISDPEHRPKPKWDLGEKMTLDHFLFDVSDSDDRLLDYESPLYDDNGNAVTAKAAEKSYQRWQNSYQYDTRRAIYEGKVKDYVRDLTNFLTIVKGHMSTTAMKKISKPFKGRDPVATMAKLLEAGIPTNLSNLRNANNALHRISWKEGTLSDLRTQIEDVAKLMEGSGVPGQVKLQPGSSWSG
jgi:hypothetical protein